MQNNEDILKLLNRKKLFLKNDIDANNSYLRKIVSRSKFLVIGGAGTIGHAVTKEIFKRNPLTLDIIDISENNLVEVVRDLRSSLGYIDGDFNTFAIDFGSQEFKNFFLEKEYDYILNLSALKHVRSEKDPYTLMRMIEVNIINNLNLLSLLKNKKVKNYFCVSTDKASNPANLMGASKRIMEIFLMISSHDQNISMARFANVAFSDGSLLFGFKNRIEKKQPISAPMDIRRYFITPQEAGELCLFSCLLGKNRDIFFPKIEKNLTPIFFSKIAENYLKMLGYEPKLVKSEDEAREIAMSLNLKKEWPCYFFKSDTTGEKEIEEFYTNDEVLDNKSFEEIGIVKNKILKDKKLVEYFEKNINYLKSSGKWDKNDILKIFNYIIPNLNHKETNKNLDQKM